MDNAPKTAVFRLKSYQFTKVSLDFDFLGDSSLAISFDPKGEYSTETGEFLLSLVTTVSANDKEIISVSCRVIFRFDNPIPFHDIPNYFYPNSLAIIFPYIRSFISTLSLQANIPPVVLPIINLSHLDSLLIENTVEK